MKKERISNLHKFEELEDNLFDAVKMLIKMVALYSIDIKGVTVETISHILFFKGDIGDEKKEISKIVMELKLVALTEETICANEFCSKFFNGRAASSLMWFRRPDGKCVVFVMISKHPDFFSLVSNDCFREIKETHYSGICELLKAENQNRESISSIVDHLAGYMEIMDIYSPDTFIQRIFHPGMKKSDFNRTKRLLCGLTRFKNKSFYPFVLEWKKDGIQFQYKENELFCNNDALVKFSKAKTVDDFLEIIPDLPAGTTIVSDCANKALELSRGFVSRFKVFLAVENMTELNKSCLEDRFKVEPDYLYEYKCSPEQLLAMCYFGPVETKIRALGALYHMHNGRFDFSNGDTVGEIGLDFVHAAEAFIACSGYNNKELNKALFVFIIGPVKTFDERIFLTDMVRALGHDGDQYKKAFECLGKKDKKPCVVFNPDDKRKFFIKKMGSYRNDDGETSDVYGDLIKIREEIKDEIRGDGSAECIIKNLCKICRK